MTAQPNPPGLERAALAAYRKGELEQAAKAFRDAQAGYASSGDRLKAAEMANNLCVTLVSLGRGREALQAVQGTAQVFEALGEPLQAARATGNTAAALAAAGEADRAIAAYQDAIERFQGLGVPDEEADTWQALSRLQLKRGDPLTAATSAQAALDLHPRPGPLRRLARSIIDRAFSLLRG